MVETNPQSTPPQGFLGDLDFLLESQAALQLKMPDDKDPREMSTEEKAIFIKDMTLALTDELHELLSEVGWKPWASSRHVNTESARGELIDALHFFLNLALALNMDGDMLKEMYHAKHKKNQQRQEAGYDGVASKCGYCRRAHDDEDKLLARGEEGCWLADDGNTGYCREAGLQIVNDLICPTCTRTFRIMESVRHNEYARVECTARHHYLIPVKLTENGAI